MKFMSEKKTILVADDEKEIRSLIRVYLEKDGFDGFMGRCEFIKSKTNFLG